MVGSRFATLAVVAGLGLGGLAGCGVDSPRASTSGSSPPPVTAIAEPAKTEASATAAPATGEEQPAKQVPSQPGDEALLAQADSPPSISAANKGLPVPAEAFFSLQIGNLKTAWEKWQKTTYFAWSHSAPMKPFKDELLDKKVPSMMNPQAFLGFEEQKLALFPDPAAFFVLPGAGEEVESTFVIQTSDKDSIDACLASAAEHFSSRKWTSKEAKVPGTTKCLVYTGPKEKDGSSPQRVYFTSAKTFGVASNLEIATTYSAGVKTGLAEQAEFQQTTADAQKFAGSATADAYWFMRPMAWVYHVKPKQAQPAPVVDKKGKVKQPKKKDDYGVVLKRQGFDSLKAMASIVTINGLNNEPEQAISVLAPAPYKKGMMMLEWQPGTQPKLPTWLPGKLASFSIVHIDAERGFNGYGHWFDEFSGSGPGLFDDIMKSMASDPAGPKVDLRKELIKNLNPTVVLMVDYGGKPTKDNPQGKRSVNYHTTDKGKAVLAALEKFYKNDPDVKRDEVNGWVVWTAPPGKTLMLEGSGDNVPKVECMAIKESDLLIGNSGGWIDEIIRSKAEGALQKDSVYKASDAQWKKWETDLTSMRGFNDREISMRRSYEGLKAGDTSLDKTQEMRMLRLMLAGDPDGNKGINYKLLPAYGDIGEFMLPSAVSVRTTKTGMQARQAYLKR